MMLTGSTASTQSTEQRAKAVTDVPQKARSTAIIVAIGACETKGEHQISAAIAPGHYQHEKEIVKEATCAARQVDAIRLVGD